MWARVWEESSIAMKQFLLYLLVLGLCANANALEAGAAKVDITPPVGTPLDGDFGRLGRGADAVHDAIWARCLYLDDGQTKVFLVSLDLWAIPPALRSRVLELVSRQTQGVHVILTATHTLNGPGGMSRRLAFRAFSGRFVPEVLEKTAQGVAEAMRNAHEKRTRAAIGYGTGTQQVLSRNAFSTGGGIDPQIGVVRVNDSDGNALAILANFAAQPATVPKGEEFTFSADYPGYFCDHVEKLANPGCVALFMNGGAADQDAADPEDKVGWARTESIGQLLAVRVKEIANDITCGEPTLHVGAASVQLPPTLASNALASTAPVQTLEIGDLAIAFFPGGPWAETALELRKRALAMGYAAQFSVGYANGRLMDFAPRGAYTVDTWPRSMSFFGPGIEDWFYTQFATLFTLGRPEAEREYPEAESLEVAGGTLAWLRGTSYEVGRARGALCAETIQDAFKSGVAEPVAFGELAPPEAWWRRVPPFIDVSPLALPYMGILARPILADASASVQEEVEGLADGAGIAFDAAWLLQCGGNFARGEAEDASTPAGVLLAVAGDRAGADDVLVGMNWDGGPGARPMVFTVRPRQGHRSMYVGTPWQVGIQSGMNDAGLVVCAERLESTSAALALRDALQEDTTIEQVKARLAALGSTAAYRVLLAQASLPGTCIVSSGEPAKEKHPENGMLVGGEDAAGSHADISKARCEQLRARFESERIIGLAEIQEAIQDEGTAALPGAAVFNASTQCSVVFEPKARRLWIAYRDESGRPGEYTKVEMTGSSQ